MRVAPLRVSSLSHVGVHRYAVSYTASAITILLRVLFPDRDSDDRTPGRAGVEARPHRAGREIKPVHIRGVVVGGPECAVANQVQTSPEGVFGYTVRPDERAIAVETRNHVTARHENAAI